MTEPKPGLECFKNFLAFKLGEYSARGLYENYPSNFNLMLDKLAEELFDSLTPSSAVSVDELLAEIGMYRAEIIRLGGSLKKNKFGKGKPNANLEWPGNVKFC